jgi:hypothetical protein
MLTIDAAYDDLEYFKPKISKIILTPKQLIFPKEFIHIFLADKPKSVSLAYSQKNKSIILNFYQDYSIDAYKVDWYSYKGTICEGKVFVGDFFKNIGINKSIFGKYISIKKIDGMETFCIDLK